MLLQHWKLALTSCIDDFNPRVKPWELPFLNTKTLPTVCMKDFQLCFLAAVFSIFAKWNLRVSVSVLIWSTLETERDKKLSRTLLCCQMCAEYEKFMWMSKVTRTCTRILCHQHCCGYANWSFSDYAALVLFTLVFPAWLLRRCFTAKRILMQQSSERQMLCVNRQVIIPSVLRQARLDHRHLLTIPCKSTPNQNSGKVYFVEYRKPNRIIRKHCWRSFIRMITLWYLVRKLKS